MKNTSDVGLAFNLSDKQLKFWSRKNPTVVMSFELAFKEYSSNDYLKSIVSFLSTKSLSEINSYFGFNPSVNQLAWTDVPIITLRNWHKESPITYVFFLLGQQQLILNKIRTKVSNDNFERIIHEVEVRELIKLYFASPISLEKLLSLACGTVCHPKRLPISSC